MLDNESSYWDQYDAYDMDQSLPVVVQQQQQPLSPRLPQLAPQVDEFRYAPYLSSCSTSSRDSYWSRHLGTQPTGTNQQCTPGNNNADSLRQTIPHLTSSSTSSSNLRRLWVVPDKLTALSLDCISAKSSNNSDSGCDSGCDVNEYDNVQIVAGNTTGAAAADDDATLVVMSAATPPPSSALLLLPAGVKTSNRCERNKDNLEESHHADMKPSSGRSQLEMCCAKESNNPIVDPAADRSPPSSPGLCFAGVNATALVTRLNFLKDQMEQEELLMSLVV
ncbi:hypothetical protein IWW38_003582 [Coemansia aciculifera]|uniref:Uncharacterized protein n=1 Tax=Coemansia aciculifera TaxID=417176 RepID=A0ACC1M0C6_9FUNG|nr:hypothetical protein IWW38_003582 [Coemansia aciculifera]